MGRINRNKGIEDLLEVHEELNEDRYSLFIAGSGKESYLKKLNDRYDLKNVNFLGYISNKDKFFSNIDIYENTEINTSNFPEGRYWIIFENNHLRTSNSFIIID